MNHTKNLAHNPPTKILFFSEQEPFPLILKSILLDEFNLETVISYDKDQYEEFILQVKPSLIIINSYTRAHIINKIKGNNIFKNIPLFYMSGSATVDDVKSLQCEAFFSKPLDIGAFIEKLKFFLQLS